MGTLVQCQPHFIRCIKPNPASQPGQLDPEYVLEQLRAGGVLEAVRIACAGFPTRKLFRCGSTLSSSGLPAPIPCFRRAPMIGLQSWPPALMPHLAVRLFSMSPLSMYT